MNNFGKRKGFTLIELLITVAIIGILVLVAFSQVVQYRKRGYNAAAISDLRNFKTSLETMFANNQFYP